MTQTQWIDQIASEYEIQIRKEQPGNDFIYNEYEISDPHGKGISLKLGFNQKGDASLLSCTNLKRFNIAEGFSSDDILNAAHSLLAGNIPTEQSRFFKRLLGVLDTSKGKFSFKLDHPLAAYNKRR
jgi:hypothetical protein